MMNEAKGRACDFNFKRAFIIFFAALLAFIAITVIYGLLTGGWQEAVEFQNNRMDARLSGDISSMIELRLEGAGRGQSTIGDRVLRGFAGVTVRMTSAEFGVFNLITILFQITFVALVAKFVYSKAQNRVKGRVQNEHHQNSNNTCGSKTNSQ